MQTTDHLLMVRPVRFAFNEETAANNAFQQRTEGDEALRIQQQAVEEFDHYVNLLRSAGVNVDVLQDTPEPFTPDSIFPNNCFSTHCDTIEQTGETVRTLVIYPMYAQNRRLERDKLRTLLDTMKFDRVVDLTSWEKEGKYLEGTGSLILDREHHIAYACRSPRTSSEVVREWAEALGYDYFLFDSTDEQGTPVYHTNVVMNLGTRFAFVCMESIADAHQRETLRSLLEEHDKIVVDLTFEQMNRFAGNMLEVRNDLNEKILVMSTTALDSLTPEQENLILQDGMRIVPVDIPVIEKAGGGSARCMIAEIY